MEASEDAEASVDANAAAIATALDEARGRKAPRKAVDEFLTAQRGLAELQKHHLKSQFTQLRLRTAGDAVRLVLQGVTLALLITLLVVVGLTVRDAMGLYGMVVEGVSAPPSFAARGVTGEGLAGDLASRIAAIARIANANSLSHSDEVRADSADSVKLEIPETGLSLDEVTRYLHRMIGHERRITGDLRDEGNGQVSLSLRMSGADPIVLRGQASDLDGLMQKAAERVSAEVDPNFVIYLETLGRTDEALAEAEHVVGLASSDRAERADAYALWANADGDRQRGLRKALVGAQIDPRSMVVWMEAAAASMALGHDEQALAYARRSLAARREDQLRQQRAGYDNVMGINRARVETMTGDYGRLEGESGPQELTTLETYVASAQAAGLLHDPARAARQLDLAAAIGKPDPTGVLRAQWFSASGAGDWPRAAEAADSIVKLTEAQAATAQAARAPRLEAQLQTLYRPWLALALARTGRIAEAQALIAATPSDCYLCTRVRAQVAEAAGDRAEADRLFAEALRQVPTPPFADLEWGQALLGRGQSAAAVARLAAAHTKSPHFADPLKAWADALAALGQPKAAAEKYDEALKLTPAWAELKLARARLGPAAG